MYRYVIYLPHLYSISQPFEEVRQVVHTNSVRERLARCAQLPPEGICDYLGVPAGGFTEEEAGDARERYGENTLEQARDSVLLRLRRAFLNFFSIVLLLLAVISFCANLVFPPDAIHDITTAPIILTMLLVSGLVRFVQEMRSKRVTDRLSRLVHTAVPVLRGGRWQELPAERLAVGDIVRLDAGDRVPADIRLLEASDFFITQALITGESGILERTAAALPAPPARLADYTNTIFLGSTVTGGSCRGVVLAVGADTLYGGIAHNKIASRKKGYDRGESSIAWVLIKFMAILVPVVFVACGVTKDDWLKAFLFALSVATGLTPELLPMVINACLARGSIQMGQKRAVVKNINAMQAFGAMDILCVDKTGTLTGNTLLLEYYMDVLGNENSKTLACAFLNSLYHTGVYNQLDAAILKTREMPGRREEFALLAKTHKKLDEISFDYTRKFASILVSAEQGSLLLVKGDINAVAARCTHIEYRGQQLPMDDSPAASLEAVTAEMLDDGRKVLAVACKKMSGTTLAPEDENGLTLLGYLAFFDAPKPSAASAIQKLQELQIGVKVLTGDNARVAASVCRRLGIASGRIFTGQDLEKLTEDELPVAIEENNIFAELSPAQKASIVQSLQENGHTVGFLGDGMNDFAATMQADVGISVDTGTDSVRDVADVILMKKDLTMLGESVLEGRRSFANMSKYIRITASSNFGNIFAIVIASVLLPFFPMTSVQLLLLNLLYDIICLILPWDNVDLEVLQKPVEWSGRRLSRFMLWFGPVSSVFDMLTFAFLYFWLCPALCGAPFGALPMAGQLRFISFFQTGWFLESIWTQILVLHLLRTQHLPLLHSNASLPVTAITVLGITLFTGLIATPLGEPLGLTALPPPYFIFLTGIVISYLLLVTVMKKIYINKYHGLI